MKLDGEWFTILMVYNTTNLDNNMENELNEFLSENLHKRVIFGGDLNASIGILGFTEYDEESSTKDMKVNEEGEKWINLFDTYIWNHCAQWQRRGRLGRPHHSSRIE